MLREEGARALAAKALGETVYRRLLLFTRELDAPLPRVSQTPGLSVGWLSLDELDAYDRLRSDRGQQALDRLAAGHRCFGTWLDGRLVAARWLASGSPLIEYLDLPLLLADGEIYHYDTFTDPGVRRRGISLSSQAHLFPTLRAEGYRRSIRALLPENRAALRDAARAGYVREGRIGFLRLGPWRRSFVRRG